MGLNRIELHQALNDAFGTGEFRQLLVAVNRRWDDFAGPLTTLPEAITQVIAKAEAQGWTADLLRAALASGPPANNPRLRAFFANNPEWDPANAQAAGIEPYKATVLKANRPFVGRKDLRECVPKLGVDTNSRILLVDGERRSGKTYTNNFLQFMGEYKSCRVRYHDLDSESHTLERFAARLQEKLGLASPIPPKDTEQDARWAERLAAWILQNTVDAANGTRLWLVLDGFREKEHERGVHDLIAKLGEMIDTTAASQADHFRLVLINYGARVSPAIAAGAFEEKALPPSLDEFRTSFVQYCTQRGLASDSAETAFSVARAEAEKQSQKDPEGQSSFLNWLNLALTKAVKKLS